MLWIVNLDDFDCADFGLISIRNVGEHSLLGLVVCVGIFFSLDRLVASMSLLPRAFARSSAMRVYPQYVPPDTLVLLWNVFTALSIIFVASTSRSALAVAFKTLHVVVEASFLVSILWLYQLRGLAVLAASSVLTIAMVVLLYPCTVSIGWAEVGGLVLDSVNFAMHRYVLCHQPTNRDLRFATRGFGVHGVYLVLYLVVNDLHRFVPLHLSDDVRATLRVLSMLMNVVSIQIFLTLERRRLMAPPGAMTLETWNEACSGTGRALWVTSRDLVLSDASDGELVALHRPLETAYVDGVTRGTSSWTAGRVEDGQVVVRSWTGCETRLDMAAAPPVDVLVRVRSPAWRDALGGVLSIVGGLLLWYL